MCLVSNCISNFAILLRDFWVSCNFKFKSQKVSRAKMTSFKLPIAHTQLLGVLKTAIFLTEKNAPNLKLQPLCPVYPYNRQASLWPIWVTTALYYLLSFFNHMKWTILQLQFIKQLLNLTPKRVFESEILCSYLFIVRNMS